jgi:hypothetical protein
MTLSPNQGVLLQPNIPHRYVTLSHPWSTWYITFKGSHAPFIVSSLGLATSTIIRWEAESPLSTVHRRSQKIASRSFDGMDGSALVYRFLIDLKRYGQVDNQRSLSQHNVRLMPIYRFLDESYSNPSLGLPDMAAYAGISPQQLSYLFRKTTGMSPYQYLIHLRIRKPRNYWSMISISPSRPSPYPSAFRTPVISPPPSGDWRTFLPESTGIFTPTECKVTHS